eukprot:UN22979
MFSEITSISSDNSPKRYNKNEFPKKLLARNKKFDPRKNAVPGLNDFQSLGRLSQLLQSADDHDILRDSIMATTQDVGEMISPALKHSVCNPHNKKNKKFFTPKGKRETIALIEKYRDSEESFSPEIQSELEMDPNLFMLSFDAQLKLQKPRDVADIISHLE